MSKALRDCPACMSDDQREESSSFIGKKAFGEEEGKEYTAYFQVCNQCGYGGHLIRKVLNV